MDCPPGRHTKNAIDWGEPIWNRGWWPGVGPACSQCAQPCAIYAAAPLHCNAVERGLNQPPLFLPRIM